MSTVSRAGIGRDLVAISGGMAAASLAVLVCLGAVHAASASGLAGPDPGSCGAVAKLDDAANGVIRATQSDDDSSIRPFVFDASLPVIITHRWPGSIIEQLKVIIPVTDHVAHGGKASDAFDVVIPSLPGYGFSGAPTALGWDPVRIARAWIVLMQRLGDTRYVAQGGDWGNAVTEQMSLLAPPEKFSGRYEHRDLAGIGPSRGGCECRRGWIGGAQYGLGRRKYQGLIVTRAPPGLMSTTHLT